MYVRDINPHSRIPNSSYIDRSTFWEAEYKVCHSVGILPTWAENADAVLDRFHIRTGVCRIRVYSKIKFRVFVVCVSCTLVKVIGTQELTPLSSFYGESFPKSLTPLAWQFFKQTPFPQGLTPTFRQQASCMFRCPSYSSRRFPVLCGPGTCVPHEESLGPLDKWDSKSVFTQMHTEKDNRDKWLRVYASQNEIVASTTKTY